MSVFVDTDVFFAHQDRRASQHDVAKRAMTLVAKGAWGHAFTSDHVFGESVTLTRARMKSHAHVHTIVNRILGRDPHPHVFDLLTVTGPVFRDAVRIVETYQDKALSFTDATTIALVQRRGIDRVLSFDQDFDGIVPRLDPRTLTA